MGAYGRRQQMGNGRVPRDPDGEVMRVQLPPLTKSMPPLPIIIGLGDETARGRTKLVSTSVHCHGVSLPMFAVASSQSRRCLILWE